MENKQLPGRVRLRHEHRWDVSPNCAKEIQEELRQRWIGEDRFSKIRTVAGLDAAFVLVGSQTLKSAAARKPASRWNALRDVNSAIGCVVLYRYPEMVEIERVFAVRPLQFPYVPGLLSFREIPVLLAALSKLRRMPALLFCDGQGYAHPRRMGLATHLGILLDRPTIGCAKSLLTGTHGRLGERGGQWVPLVDAGSGREGLATVDSANSKVIGAVLRTRSGVRPIYVSQGNRVSLATALRLTLSVTDGLRIPRPTRDADHFASETKRKLLRGQLSEK
jgi:deoxyribonuclease V